MYIYLHIHIHEHMRITYTCYTYTLHIHAHIRDAFEAEFRTLIKTETATIERSEQDRHRLNGYLPRLVPSLSLASSCSDVLKMWSS